MIFFFKSLWYGHLRGIDLALLWPSCKNRAGNLDDAKTVFAIHAFCDKAWLFLGEDEIYRIIDSLV